MHRSVTACCVPVSCSFDLIFLDANKDGYQSYYNTIMDQQLLAPSGLLVVDNTLMKVRGGTGHRMIQQSCFACCMLHQVMLTFACSSSSWQQCVVASLLVVAAGLGSRLPSIRKRGQLACGA